jgi:hypothetical protein
MSLTWIPRAAIGTCAITRDRLYELLQRALVARLLALVQRGRHVNAGEVAVARRWRCGASSGTNSRGSRKLEVGKTPFRHRTNYWAWATVIRPAE